MPAADRASKPEAEIAPRYTLAELRHIRRNVLRYARSYPPGPLRNQHRQIASSLHRLLTDAAWLEREGMAGGPDPAIPRGLRSVVV
jgi:hypothetical protein